MHTRKLFALLGALALTFSVATTALATKPSPHQVTICHRTDSNTNPYVIETVDIASSGLLRGGHNDHTGPVWNPTLKAAHIKWGDIIPPYTYGTFVYPGMNYAEGLAIYEAGCTIPSEPAHNPAIHIVKTPSVTTLPAGGGDVTYTYVVTNTGDVPLSTISVSDNKCSAVAYVSGDTNDDGVLDLTETWTYTCTATLSATTTNTATATGHYGDTTVTDTAEATVTVAAASAPAIHVVKSADPTTLPAGGGPVEYTYLVTNTGNIALTGVTVTDDKCATVTGPTGDTGSDGVLGLTETWTYTCTTSLTATTTNTVTATGHAGATEVSDTDQATVSVAAASAPAIHVVKSASVSNLPAGGGEVTYTYVVTNTGNVALTGITVTDDKCASVTGPTGDTGSDGILGLTETWTYTCSATLSATTTNTATATGHAGATEVSDTDQATVTVAAAGQAGVSLAKTANPTTLPVGGGDVTYVYVVTNTGGVSVTELNASDGAWVQTGPDPV